ncbi:MAG: hypothetical protein ACI9TA_003370 [Reinekea sp.]|jgi:hypothetical protein
MGGGPVKRNDFMQVLGLSHAKNAISAIWGAINGDTQTDVGFDPYEREPLQRSELSDIFAVKLTQTDGAELSKHEQFERDTMFTLRGILHD